MQKIIDSHHHIWNKVDVPWLADEPKPRIFGPYEAIRRDYLIDELLSDFEGFNIEKSVYIQCNWDPSRALEESAWVQSVANANQFPHGIVSYVDLTASDAAKKIEAQLQYKNVKGIRQQLHWHENPHWSYVTDPVMFNQPAFRKGMDVIEKHNLAFDLQIFPSQMVAATEFAAAYPNTPMILNHAGMPEDRSPEGWNLWLNGMRSLAKSKNVLVKFSGLNTYEHKCDVEKMLPVIQESLSIFGANRCMYGSNFPIEKLWTNYGTYLNAVIQCVGNVSSSEFEDIFYNTAKTAYKL